MFIAIDGASRRNGKPDCIAAGGAFIVESTKDGKVAYSTVAVAEEASTNQRGEMLALIAALQCFSESKDTTCFILTDSEYIFNAVNNNWTERWRHNGYKTAAGADVKNKDLWEVVDNILCNDIYNCNKELLIYHIKGHTIALGPKTVKKIYEEDTTCEKLFHAFEDRFEERLRTLESDEVTFEVVQELSKKNNGFILTPYNLKTFICYNAVADAIATIKVEDENNIFLGK